MFKMGSRALTTKATSYAKMFTSTNNTFHKAWTVTKSDVSMTKKEELEQQKRFFGSQPKKGNQHKCPGTTPEDYMESNRRVVFALNIMKSDKFRKCKVIEKDQLAHFYTFDKAPMVQDSLPKLKEPSQIAQPLMSLPCSHVGASYIYVGDHVYHVGGSSEYCLFCGQYCRFYNMRCIFVTNTYRCDINRNAWTRLSHMNTARFKPHLHFLGGKVYAIGGHSKWNDDPIFMEVFDEKNGWSPLPCPRDLLDHSLNGSIFSATLEHEGCILIGFTERELIYCFTPPDSWSHYSKRNIFIPRSYWVENNVCVHSPAVVVEKHLIWMDVKNPKRLHCLDIELGRRFVVSLWIMKWLSPVTKQYQLLQVEGDRLSLVWLDVYNTLQDPKPPKDKDQHSPELFGAYHCCIFRINFEKADEDEENIDCVTVLSHQIIFAPTAGYLHIAGAFIQDVTLKKVATSEKGKKKCPSKRGCGSKHKEQNEEFTSDL